MYATEWEKTPDGRLILDANTGLPTQSAFKTKVGNQSPDVRFGLQNTFKIKDFTVNIDMDGAIGGTLISTTTQKMWWGESIPNLPCIVRKNMIMVASLLCARRCQYSKR